MAAGIKLQLIWAEWVCHHWTTSVDTKSSPPGGGVAVWISDDINFIERHDAQSLKDIIVGVIYRPPNKESMIFNNHMKLLLAELQKENKSCYSLGDMNIKILNQEPTTKLENFVHIMFSHSFLL